jgi:putative membrane protein
MLPLDQFPALNATLNSITTLLLSLGFVFIKTGRIQAHRRCMISAFATSAVFLACYLYYHFHHPTTKFTTQGPIQIVYYIVLGTHVILALVVLPFIFAAFYQALRGNFEKHKKIVRWTWPIWMYVSVTGVLVYFMLYQWFG